MACQAETPVIQHRLSDEGDQPVEDKYTFRRNAATLGESSMPWVDLSALHSLLVPAVSRAELEQDPTAAAISDRDCDTREGETVAMNYKPSPLQVKLDREYGIVFGRFLKGAVKNEGMDLNQRILKSILEVLTLPKEKLCYTVLQIPVPPDFDLIAIPRKDKACIQLAIRKGKTARAEDWEQESRFCAPLLPQILYIALRCYPFLTECSMVCLAVVLSPAELTLKQHLEQMLNGSDGVSEQRRVAKKQRELARKGSLKNGNMGSPVNQQPKKNNVMARTRLQYTNVLFTYVQKGGNPMSPQDCMLCMLLERLVVPNKGYSSLDQSPDEKPLVALDTDSDDDFDMSRYSSSGYSSAEQINQDLNIQLLKDGYRLDEIPDDEDLDLIPPKSVNPTCMCCQATSSTACHIQYKRGQGGVDCISFYETPAVTDTETRGAAFMPWLGPRNSDCYDLGEWKSLASVLRLKAVGTGAKP
ncbi:hypothetical protein IHE44_0011694 [Lamprotornis superbus]|uniref:Uncharacterized protein n=15 Tax=Aves TaxID=8782 RepID=A0A835NJL2_9PASS|nr:hypothetical protein IHE44_0011694 [Lamprotornis superbus]